MADDPVVHAIMQDIVAPLLLAACSAAGAWIVARLPGPIRDALASAVHARDVALLTGTMGRRALAEAANPATPPPTPAEIVRYTEAVLPALLAKLNLTPDGLETIAAAAIVRADAVTAARPAAVPPAGDVAP